MMDQIIYCSNQASEEEVASHLWRCDVDFIPPLSSRIEIGNYAAKIVSNATRFEAWFGSNLVGLVAIYCNDKKDFLAFISNVSIQKDMSGKGIARNLLQQSIEYVMTLGVKNIILKVDISNSRAIRLYEKIGFIPDIKNENESNIFMNLKLDN